MGDDAHLLRIRDHRFLTCGGEPIRDVGHGARKCGQAVLPRAESPSSLQRMNRTIKDATVKRYQAGTRHARGMLVEAAWAAARARAHSVPSSCGCGPAPASTSPPSRPRASSPSLASAGAGEELSVGKAVPAPLRSCAMSSSRQVIGRPADKEDRRMPTISKATGKKSAAGWSRPKPPMPALSPAGTHEVRRGCARAPQMRRTVEAARQGSHLGPALRHEVSHAQQENIANPIKKLLSTR